MAAKKYRKLCSVSSIERSSIKKYGKNIKNNRWIKKWCNKTKKSKIKWENKFSKIILWCFLIFNVRFFNFREDLARQKNSEFLHFNFLKIQWILSTQNSIKLTKNKANLLCNLSEFYWIVKIESKLALQKNNKIQSKLALVALTLQRILIF